MSSDKEKKVDADDLRRRLIALSELIRELNEKDQLLDAVPELLHQMGDLRSRLFEWEVRCTGRLLPKSSDPPEVIEAQRIVDEAIRRWTAAAEDWEGDWAPEVEEDEEG